MLRIDTRRIREIALIAGSISIIIILYPYIAEYYGSPQLLSRDIYYILSFITFIFPLGIAHLLNVMWRRAVDRNIPKLLRHLAEAGRIGVSIPKALKIASKYDLGPLSDELKKAVVKLSWGYPFKKVMEDIADDIGTPTARRAFKLIVEASESGGNIEETLLILQRHIMGMQLTLRERLAIMKPYISYGYIAFFVFLAIEVVLLKSFFIPILEVKHSLESIGGGAMQLFKVSISISQIKQYFYHASILEAIISGLVAGKLGEGTIFAGLKHVAVLLIATILTYYLFIF